MRLRPVLSDNDIQRVVELAAICWHSHYTAIIGGEQVRYMLERFQSREAINQQIAGGRDYRLIEDDEGQSHGYLAWDLHPDHLFLSKLYILPTSQRRGLARQALELLQGEQPGREIRLTVNKHNAKAIAFYQAMDFRNCGALVTDIGNGFVMDDWEMRRPPEGGVRR
ncbi:MAG TPA: GNAT family N-acetyltransferase [Luteolibacter sp.]|nr:GNAT family N-acetyltransferase [Luteolibacter sp.]